jgi:hypothetical protein
MTTDRDHGKCEYGLRPPRALKRIVASLNEGFNMALLFSSLRISTEKCFGVTNIIHPETVINFGCHADV